MYDADPYCAQVHQASGMVSVQANCSLDEALFLMRERAEETHQSLREIADSTLGHQIRFARIR